MMKLSWLVLFFYFFILIEFLKELFFCPETEVCLALALLYKLNLSAKWLMSKSFAALNQSQCCFFV